MKIADSGKAAYSSCRYSFKRIADVPVKPFCFSKMHADAKKALVDTFFGPPDSGVYSPSVQNTLFLMGKAVLNRSPLTDQR